MCYQWNGCYDYKSIEVENQSVYLTINLNRNITRKLITCMNEEVKMLALNYDQQAVYINGQKFELNLTLVPSSVAILNETKTAIQLISCRIEGK